MCDSVRFLLCRNDNSTMTRQINVGMANPTVCHSERSEESCGINNSCSNGFEKAKRAILADSLPDSVIQAGSYLGMTSVRWNPFICHSERSEESYGRVNCKTNGCGRVARIIPTDSFPTVTHWRGITASLNHRITASRYHGITVSRHHGITASRFHGITE